MLKRWFIAGCIILTAFFCVPRVQASENFDTHLETTYTVALNGKTRVQHHFTIVNKKPLFMVKQYGLKVSSPDVTNVTVTSGSEVLKPEIVTTENQTSIGITFQDKVVGEGNQRDFTISYTDPNAALISGQVLEVAVPQLATAGDYTAYIVKLITPAQFGSPKRVTPNSFSTSRDGDNILTTFTQLSGEAVSAIYGDQQTFDLTLRYYLENPSDGPRLTQIALPPDTPYQKMYYHSIEPSPQKIELDADGNWLATYQLQNRATQTILVNAQAQLTLEPNPNVPSPTAKDALLSEQPYWEIHDPIVAQTAAQLSSERDVYTYVVNHLSYNYNRLSTDISRLGAATALKAPDQALCQEFADTFIALSRAIGVPARRITGYAYAENSQLRPLSLVEDVLHAWPEYYDVDAKRWIPVDPTWGHTSGGSNFFDIFDLNHVVFAINGHSSQTPFPAGSYKAPNLESKDVAVTFGVEPVKSDLKLEFKTEPRKLLGIPIPGRNMLVVTNTTGEAAYGFDITVSTPSGIELQSQPILYVDALLPFQSKRFPVYATHNQGWHLLESRLQIQYDTQTENVTIQASSEIWDWITNPYIALSVGLGSVIVALITWSLLVLRRS